MTYPSFGPDDPLSRDALASTVSAIRPDWRLLDADPIPAGSDIVYTVTVAPTERNEGDSEATHEAVLDEVSFSTLTQNEYNGGNEA